MPERFWRVLVLAGSFGPSVDGELIDAPSAAAASDDLLPSPFFDLRRLESDLFTSVGIPPPGDCSDPVVLGIPVRRSGLRDDIVDNCCQLRARFFKYLLHYWWNLNLYKWLYLITHVL